MTDYEQTIFTGIETKMEMNKWYTILQTRPDLNEFTEAIKLRIDLKGDCEFSEDYMLFKKTMTNKEIIEDFDKPTDWMPRIIAMHNHNSAELMIKFPLKRY